MVAAWHLTMWAVNLPRQAAGAPPGLLTGLLAPTPACGWLVCVQVGQAIEVTLWRAGVTRTTRMTLADREKLDA